MRPTFVVALAACLLAAGAARADVKAGVDAWNQGDYVRAVEAWRPLALGGNADAQFNIGQAYKLGRGVPVDLPVALEWFRKATEQGHEKAADNYGLLLFQQGRREESMPFVKASAERGEPRAQYVYATALFNGDLAPQDWVRAYALMTRAAQAGVTQATASLSQMDSYVPEDQRRQGLALATVMARDPGASASAAPVIAPTPVTAQAGPPPSATPAARTPSPIATGEGPDPRPPVRKAEPARPSAAQAAASVPSPSASGRWRVQLGAFREQGRAQALWQSLSGKVSGLSAFKPSFVPGNGLTRLLVGPLASSADAQRLCARIKPTGTPCIVQSS